jgi:hypothetical protein
LPDSFRNDIEFAILASGSVGSGEAEAALIFQTKVRLNGYLHTEEIKVKVGTGSGDDDELRLAINLIYDKLTGNAPTEIPLPINTQSALGLFNVAGMEAHINSQIQSGANQFLNELVK